jgi:3-dehydroquinate synthetase
LFAALEESGGELSSWWQPQAMPWIVRALRVKIDVVESDPFERGQRAVLNLGHTVGHALEMLSNFSMRHGEAVSIGMVAASRIAVAMGLTERTVATRIEALLSGIGLPVGCPPFRTAAIWRAMAHDKKKRDRSLCWVLPRSIGRAEVVENVDADTVTAVLQEMGARG